MSTAKSLTQRPYELLELGITHRLNMAAEVVRKFPAADSEPRILHVPMRDAFSNEKDGWKKTRPFLESFTVFLILAKPRLFMSAF